MDVENAQIMHCKICDNSKINASKDTKGKKRNWHDEISKQMV
jgi:hypothetical protein